MKKYIKTFFIVLFLHNLPYSAHGFIQRFFENFHVVEPGKLYRSAQLTSKRLEYYAKAYNIKTIINLRGKNPLEQWWLEEFFTTQRLGVTLYDISMNSSTLPSKKNLLLLLKVYNNAKKPILIHCLSGADRTGEAAALWKLVQQGKNKQSALQELSWHYGHLTRRKRAKQFLIKIWQNVAWLTQEYTPENYPQFCK